MAFTRFKYDECRTKKSLQQSTDPGRWILNVPGNGANPCYIEDPQIIPQKWGGNLRTNTINLENDLLGVNRKIGRDCLNEIYTNYNVQNDKIEYPICDKEITSESRATNPAWWYRDLEQVDWQYPQINPQINTCIPFQNNISSRIIEKDNFTPKRDCISNEIKNYMPLSYNLIHNGGGYIGKTPKYNSYETLNK